jgi:hypothetical protein
MLIDHSEATKRLSILRKRIKDIQDGIEYDGYRSDDDNHILSIQITEYIDNLVDQVMAKTGIRRLGKELYQDLRYKIIKHSWVQTTYSVHRCIENTHFSYFRVMPDVNRRDYGLYLHYNSVTRSLIESRWYKWRDGSESLKEFDDEDQIYMIKKTRRIFASRFDKLNLFKMMRGLDLVVAMNDQDFGRKVTKLNLMIEQCKPLRKDIARDLPWYKRMFGKERLHPEPPVTPDNEENRRRRYDAFESIKKANQVIMGPSSEFDQQDIENIRWMVETEGWWWLFSHIQTPEQVENIAYKKPPRYRLPEINGNLKRILAGRFLFDWEMARE